MNTKKFYENHKNFSFRTLSEYFISPGIKCKFDLLKNRVGSNFFNDGIDLGSSGNSFLHFLENVIRKSILDVANQPLKQYLNICSGGKRIFFPVCGDIAHLPYRNNSFDFISALDVLEHIKRDDLAISEISRILKTKGIAVITVPHRMKYFKKQDKLIGHYRRYEIEQIVSLFKKYNFKLITAFGVYGKMMKIAVIQSLDPKKLENNLIKLRNRYESNLMFRCFWDLFVFFSSTLMKLDAKYRPLKKVMNIAFIFIKM